ATKADYEAALRSITYKNSNDDNPSIAIRTVTFSVTDSNSNGETPAGGTTSATREIHIQAINDAPTWNGTTLPESRGREGDPLRFPLDPVTLFADVDTPVLTYTFENLPEFLHFDPDTHTLTGTPAKGDEGGYAINITATDEAGATATMTMKLVIDPAPPFVAPPEAPQDATPAAEPLPPRDEPPPLPTTVDHALKELDEERHLSIAPLQTESPFHFSPLRDARHELEDAHLFPDPALAATARAPNPPLSESTLQLVMEQPSTNLGEESAHLVHREPLAPNAQESDTLSRSHAALSRRMDLQIGTTLRETDAQSFTPPMRDDDQKNQRGGKGYGVTEAQSEEGGMPGLTHQLNKHGTKAFHSASQELLRLLKGEN
ncbi:MAG: putative Ig domain-containing protein, partial [Magnetococcus sp. YQC-9]